MIRIAVFGAGAIGCWVGGRLALGGADVMLIGRTRVLDELADGLTLSELGGHTRTLRVRAAARDDAGLAATAPRASSAQMSTDPSAAAHAEIVLVTVKAAQTPEAGATLARIVSPQAIIVSLQNGVRNAELLRALLPRHTVLAGMVPWNVVRRSAGEYHRGSSGALVLEQHRTAELLYAAIAAAGLAFDTHVDMAAVQWAKLLMNLNNAINALSGKPLAAQLADRSYRRCLAACQREALGLLDVARVPIARLTLVPPRLMPRLLDLPDPVFRVLARSAITIDPHARSSMWDDLEAKRPTEIDYLQGEVVALAKRLDREAPINRKLVELVRAAEGGGRRDFGGDELYRAMS